LQFCLDTSGALLNNTVYFLPISDAWLLCALNAPVGWWFGWRAAQHAKDEALRYFTSFVENYPVPIPSAELTTIAVGAVDRIVSVRRAIREARELLSAWHKGEHGIDKPTAALKEPLGLTVDAFVAAVRKARGRGAPLSAAAIQAIKDEHARTVVPTTALRAEVERLERQVSDAVNAAYGLTPEEAGLMWETAPPRMPIAPPPGP
jgi:hypothetical protein